MPEFKDDSTNEKPIETNNCVFKLNQVKRNIDKFSLQINNYIERQANLRKKIILCKDNKERKKQLIDYNRCQMQLESILSSLQKLKQHLAEEDFLKFDEATKDIIEVAENAIFQSKEHYQVCLKDIARDPDQSTSSAVVDKQQPQQQITLQCNTDPRIVEHRITALNNDISDIADIMKTLNEEVCSQGEIVSKVEDNVSDALENVTAGASTLAKAAKYKMATLSTTGALIGGGVFGPLGLMVGAKLGALAAVSGGALGFYSGKYITNKQEETIDSSNESSETIQNCDEITKKNVNYDDEID